jgi:hypothetical protein
VRVKVDDGAFLGQAADLHDVVTFEGVTWAKVGAAFRASVDDYLGAARPGIMPLVKYEEAAL